MRKSIESLAPRTLVHVAVRLAARLVRNNEDAEDIAQDAYIRLLERYRHRPEPEHKALMVTITRTLSIDHLHHRKVVERTVVPIGDLAAGDDEDGSNHLEALMLEVQPSAEDEARWHQLRRALITAITALPKQQQRAILLHELEGASTEETAREMGCTAGSVKTHCSRARATLRPQLAQWRAV